MELEVVFKPAFSRLKFWAFAMVFGAKAVNLLVLEIVLNTYLRELNFGAFGMVLVPIIGSSWTLSGYNKSHEKALLVCFFFRPPMSH